MAISHVVDVCDGHVTGATLHPTTLPFSIGELDRGVIEVFPRPPCGSSDKGLTFDPSISTFYQIIFLKILKKAIIVLLDNLWVFVLNWAKTPILVIQLLL